MSKFTHFSFSTVKLILASHTNHCRIIRTDGRRYEWMSPDIFWWYLLSVSVSLNLVCQYRVRMDICYWAAEKQRAEMIMAGQIMAPMSHKMKDNYTIICDEFTVRWSCRGTVGIFGYGGALSHSYLYSVLNNNRVTSARKPMIN